MASPPLPGSAPQSQPRPAGSPLRPAAALPTGPKPKTQVQAHTQGDVGVVTILAARILDETNIAALGQELTDLVKKQYMVKMVIDLGEVKYLSSAVLRQFIALYKLIKAEKGNLKLCRIDPNVREVFKITQLDKMIEIFDDVQKAVNSFKRFDWGLFKR
ncbi:MAG: STAS domain-containing protein [Planctomycetota bacterium]